jgi:hypothetical protein
VSLLLGPIYVDGAPEPGAVGISNDEVDGYLIAIWTIANDGLIYHRSGQGGNTYQPPLPSAVWISPQVGMNLYECRAQAIDTMRPIGTYDTWLDLAQSWSWGWQMAVRGTQTVTDKEGSFQLEIRRKSDQVVVASITVLVSAAGNA